jgi:hypothetical protein
LAAFLQRIEEADQARTTLLEVPPEAKIDCTTVLWSCFRFFIVAPDGDLACLPESNQGALTDQQHDLLLDGLAQRRPGIDEQLQMRVQRMIFCEKCAGFCAALRASATVSRALLHLFESCPRYLSDLHTLASCRITTHKPLPCRGLFRFLLVVQPPAGGCIPSLSPTFVAYRTWVIC